MYVYAFPISPPLVQLVQLVQVPFHHVRAYASFVSLIEVFVSSNSRRYITPIQRRMSLRLATTMRRMRMANPTYSALIMNFSEGLRPVIIS